MTATLGVEEVFQNANCGDHPLTISEDLLVGAETIVAMGRCNCRPFNVANETCNSYCDTESFAVAKLADGRFVTVTESSDTSGHGCRCDGSADVYDTLHEAIRLGLTEEQRVAARSVLEPSPPAS